MAFIAEDIPDADDAPAVTDDEIVREARSRFRRGMDYESQARERYRLDFRFAAGDAHNLYQWDDAIYTARNGQARPSLTINKVRQHNLQIINDAKQNKTSVKISPVGGGATAEAAEVFEGIIRHIEYISNASTAYDTATETQVNGGWGHWRIMTDYASEDSFDQEIYIRRIADPLSVLIDPDAHEADKSDARWGFVFTDVQRKVFKLEYPQYADLAPQSGEAWGYNDGEGWNDQDHVRIAEYYRMSEVQDELIGYPDANGDMKTSRASELGKLAAEIKKRPGVVTRKIKRPTIEWYKIVGYEIVDQRDWVGRTVPLPMIVGDETKIDGRLDRSGHTRWMLDAQRSYNYHVSAAVEAVGYQTKTPWLAAAESLEGNEEAWANINTQTPAVLTYRAIGDEGSTIPPPQRISPPQFAAAYGDLMQIAAKDIESVSGQHEAEMGKPSNEKSGVAIQQRQRQSDLATFQYADNRAIGIRRTGKDLLQLIPLVYDTKRTLRILGEDGSEMEITIDPTAEKAYEEHKAQETGEVVARIFNPNVGHYEVQADSGPNYATKRQETLNMMVQVLTQAPELVHVIGDLLFKNMDVAGAQEIAERLNRLVPPQALGEGIPPAQQQLQQQLQEAVQKGQSDDLQRQLVELENAKLKLTLRGKDEKYDVLAYDAETKRLNSLKEMLPMDLEALHILVQKTVREALSGTVADVDAANAPTLAADAQGPDASVSQPQSQTPPPSIAPPGQSPISGAP